MADTGNWNEQEDVLKQKSVSERPVNTTTTSTTRKESIPDAVLDTRNLSQSSETGVQGHGQLNNFITLRELLHEMYSCLNDYMEINKKVLLENMKTCKAMMFLSLKKGGIGEGLLLTSNVNKNSWNAPCAISLKYKSTAIELTSDKINYLLLTNSEKIMCLPGNEYSILGIDIPITFQNVNQNEILKDNESLIYLLSKDVSDSTHNALNGAVISINKLSNQQYYQGQVNEIEILNGTFKPISENNYFLLSQMLCNWTGVKRDNANVKKPFELNTKIPLCRYYTTNEDKNFSPAYQQLLELPIFPYLNDIKKRSRNTSKLANIGKKIYGSFKYLWNADRKGQNNNDNTNTNINTIEKKWYFDEYVPLYQYYCGNSIIYDKKQIAFLPKLPFYDDVIHKRYSLQRYNPINAIRSYLKTNRRASAIYNYYYNKVETDSKSHWRFDENAPLYQYYQVHNENIEEMNNAIHYNKIFLSKMPLYPFAKDIKIRKYSLFRYNPVTFSKKLYHQFSHKFIEHQDVNTNKNIDNNDMKNDTNFDTVNTNISTSNDLETNTNTNLNTNTNTNTNTYTDVNTNTNVNNFNTDTNINTNANTNFNTDIKTNDNIRDIGVNNDINTDDNTRYRDIGVNNNNINVNDNNVNTNFDNNTNTNFDNNNANIDDNNNINNSTNNNNNII